MKVFVFKRSNEPIGKFDIDRVDAIAQGFAQFATSHPVKCASQKLRRRWRRFIILEKGVA